MPSCTVVLVLRGASLAPYALQVGKAAQYEPQLTPLPRGATAHRESASYPILPNVDFRLECGRSRLCRDGLFLENLQDVTGVRTVAIVDIRVRIDDDPIAVDDVGR